MEEPPKQNPSQYEDSTKIVFVSNRVTNKDIFQVFIDKNIDLRVLDRYTPLFDEKPGLDNEGFLVLKGHFATRPSIAIFDMKFMKIGDTWKLMRLFVNIKPVEDSKN